MGSADAIFELGVFIFYLIIILGGLIFLILAFKKKSKASAIGCILCVITILAMEYHRRTIDHQNQLTQIGIYYLIDYPNYDSCVAVLKDDNTYEVQQKDKIIESGNWHFDNGGDALIVYMNDGKDRLGDGRFECYLFKDANNIIHRYPLSQYEINKLTPEELKRRKNSR